MKYTKEEFLKAAELGEVSMIDAKHICSRLDEVVGLSQQNDDVREQGNAKKVLSKLKEFRDSLTSEEKLKMFPNDVRKDDVEKLSSVEWLWEEIDNLIPYEGIESSQIFNGLLDKAKEMHRKEIIDAWNSAAGGDAHTIGEQYYYSTFIPDQS